MSPAHDPFSAVLPSVNEGATYTFGSLPLCLAADGPALVTSVEPVSPQGGISFGAFAVRPLQPNMLGSEASPLPKTDFGDGRVVHEHCDTTPGGAELAVEMTKQSADNARTSGVRVNYSVDGRPGTLVIPFTVVLCATADMDGPACRAWPDS